MLRAADQICATLPSAIAPFGPCSTVSPDCRRPSATVSASAGTIAPQPRKFASGTLRAMAAQACSESLSFCNSISRTRALYCVP